MEENEENISDTELTILEIISEHRGVHRTLIMGQMKEMSEIMKQSFDKDSFTKSLLRLEKVGYINRLKSNDDMFIITSTGKERIE